MRIKKALASVMARQKKRIADETDVAKLNLQVLAKEETLLRLKQTFSETSRKIARAIGEPSATHVPVATFNLSPLAESESIVIHQYNQSRSKRMFDLIKTKVNLDYQQVITNTFPNIFHHIRNNKSHRYHINHWVFIHAINKKRRQMPEN